MWLNPHGLLCPYPILRSPASAHYCIPAPHRILTLSVGWNAEDFLATVPTDLLQRIANVYALDLVMDFESVEGQVSRPQP